MSFAPPAAFDASSFPIFRRSLMQNDGLPLTEVVDSDRFAQVFEKHGVDFGDEEGVVYTPAITLWALVSQTFFAGTQRSCKAAVLRVAALWATARLTVLTRLFRQDLKCNPSKVRAERGKNG
jgi:hypothetical protein